MHYLGVSVAVLFVRFAAVTALEAVFASGRPLFVLVLGAGMSFVANLALNNFVVSADMSSGKSKT